MLQVGEKNPWFREFFQTNLVFIQPLGVWFLRADGLLEFIITDDTTLFQIDDKHLAGLQSPFFADIFRIYGQHTRFGGHDYPVVVGNAVTGRAETVAVQGGSDDLSVRE